MGKSLKGYIEETLSFAWILDVLYAQLAAQIPRPLCHPSDKNTPTTPPSRSCVSCAFLFSQARFRPIQTRLNCLTSAHFRDQFESQDNHREVFPTFNLA